MRGSLVLALAFAAAACQSQIPYGAGPVTIQPNVQLSFQRYLDRRDPVVFLVSVDGSVSYGVYCPHIECETDPLYIVAERRCAERTGKPCMVFAEDRKIVWQGPVAYASAGEGPVAGATVDRGEIGTLYGLKIDGLAAGAGTFAGKIRDAACAGSIDLGAASWRLECGSEFRARGSLSKAGAGQWAGFGWSNEHLPVRLFVVADIAIGRERVAVDAAAPAFPHLPPTFEAPLPPLIRGDNRINPG